MPIRLAGRLASRTSREVTVLDLSLTGCLVRCPSRLLHGAILDLSVTLGAEPFRAKVRVAQAFIEGEAGDARGQGYLAGLEFMGLQAVEHVRLVRFLEEARRRRSAHAPAH
jgi:hypothetical protein